MTNEERIRSLHARTAALRRARERRKTGAAGVSCAVLAICLLFMIFSGGGGMHAGGAAGLFSGATMLFEGAGPYVLIAIIAFMAGTVITALCIRYRMKRGSGQDRAKKEEESQ